MKHFEKVDAMFHRLLELLNQTRGVNLVSYNLLSYVTLRGTYIMCKKAKGYNINDDKRRLLEEVCRNFKIEASDYVKRNLKEVEEALLANGYYVKVCKVKAISRVIVGTSESFAQVPFEVGLFFDPVLNVPFIPGSTLKGAFRQALEELIRREITDNSQAKEIADIIFGKEGLSGLVGVTDAYPVKSGEGGRLFEPDVLTPHYPCAKTELDVKPNPVLFLTIAPGVEFQFYVYFNKETYGLKYVFSQKMRELHKKRRLRRLGTVRYQDLAKSEVIKAAEALDRALYHDELVLDLSEALQRCNKPSANIIPYVDRAILHAFARGIGAKTSVGYSRFTIVEYKSLRLTEKK